MAGKEHIWLCNQWVYLYIHNYIHFIHATCKSHGVYYTYVYSIHMYTYMYTYVYIYVYICTYIYMSIFSKVKDSKSVVVAWLTCLLRSELKRIWTCRPRPMNAADGIAKKPSSACCMVGLYHVVPLPANLCSLVPWCSFCHCKNHRTMSDSRDRVPEKIWCFQRLEHWNMVLPQILPTYMSSSMGRMTSHIWKHNFHVFVGHSAASPLVSARLAMDVDVSFDGSPGSRVRISTPNRTASDGAGWDTFSYGDRLR